MKRIIVVFITVLSLSIVYANSLDTPLVIDEFGKVSSEVLESKLDKYAVEFSEHPNTYGYIIINPGEKDLPGFSFRYAARMKKYLAERRGIAGGRIVVVHAPVGPEIKVRLYLVAIKNDEPIKENELKDIDFTDFASNFGLSKTFQFDSYFYKTEDDLGTCCVTDEYVKEETETSLKVISKILKQSPESKVYLSAYTCLKCQKSDGKFKADSPELANKILNEAKQILSKNGIEDARIVISKGKTEAFRGVDVWFVPKGGEIPKPKPDYFPQKKQNMK